MAERPAQTAATDGAARADAPAGLPPPPRMTPDTEWKAGLLVLFTLALIVASGLYLLYARGAFEPTQRLVLIADDSEGVTVGMNLTFSGFPIGRVRAIELGDDGSAHILIDVPKKDARWLRESSVFTLVRGLVGGTAIRAYSGILTDPPLPDGARRKVLAGDATAEAQRVLSQARDFVSQLSALAADDGALGAMLANLKVTTERLNGPRGALGVLTGNEADARKLVAALDHTNALLARLDGVAARVDQVLRRTDGVLANADRQIFGADGGTPAAPLPAPSASQSGPAPQTGRIEAGAAAPRADAGAVAEARIVLRELGALLGESRQSLRRLDALLVDAQAVAANARAGTQDLGQLRADVEANLRKVEGMLNELNRKWPFARDTEVKLP